MVMDAGVGDGGADAGGAEEDCRTEDCGAVEISVAVEGLGVTEPSVDVTFIEVPGIVVGTAVEDSCDKVPLERVVRAVEEDPRSTVVDEVVPGVVEVGDCNDVELVGRAHDPCLLRRLSTPRFFVCVMSHENENVYSQVNALST